MTGMKNPSAIKGFTIVVAGKGGTGKTLVSALLVRDQRRHGAVLAIDADPDANLPETLGVKAQSAYSLFPNEDPLEKEKILELAGKEDLETLLVTRVTRKKSATETRSYTTGTVYLAPRFAPYPHPRHYPYYYDWYGYYYLPGASITTYSYDYTLLNLETNLYAIATNELVWSAELAAVHESRIAATVQDINRATINQMIRDGVLKR